MRKHSYKLFRIYGYPGFALLLYLILILINPLDNVYKSWRNYAATDFLLEFGFNIAYTILLFETGIQLTALLNRFRSWENFLKTRFVLQFVLHIIIIYVMIRLFFTFRFPAYFGYDTTMERQTIIIGIIFSLLITAVFAAEHFFYKWNDARLMSVEMEKLTTQAQLDALKLQLDPHFLFNNLSTVSALIDTEPMTALSYISNLSSIYRYMLTTRLKNVIPLSAELDFIKSYLYLYQVRYGEGIIVTIDDTANKTAMGLPPLTLQLLIENAIKHNTFSMASPLKINITFTYDNRLVVENNKRLVSDKESSTQVGLKNISERYMLMNQTPPIISDLPNVFRVEVQLINIDELQNT
ncbi:sensor histidine kinase [Mucilaginibacter sp. KACC 22063]|uniref:sensor histidine kinase n=1 Tax=Mucilaginibacter sp. KACC 22063 TaxID=3025666 RepID=UPI0023665895|nr:histidine kinase [Mucilaginibacter sp. KACC 22063]WDF57336.1 histidine kinase [Mucilaginibacter sp. KACC 22063]